MDFYMLALDSGRPGTYNVGTDRFGTLRADLEELARYAGSPSRVKSLPEALAINTLRLLYHMRMSHLCPGITSLTTKTGTSMLATSEEHTSQLQSNIRITSSVFCLKKKKQQ